MDNIDGLEYREETIHGLQVSHTIFEWLFPLLRDNLDPVAVGVRDEVDTHSRVLKADAAHGFVLGVQGIVLAGVEGQVELALPQVVGLGAVPEPGQLQKEGAAGLIPQENQLESAVGGLLLPHGGEVLRLILKGLGTVQFHYVVF